MVPEERRRHHKPQPKKKKRKKEGEVQLVKQRNEKADRKCPNQRGLEEKKKKKKVAEFPS